MTFSDYARHQAETMLDALINRISEAAREELDALRAAFDTQIGTSMAACGSANQSESLEHLVRNLSQAATEQAEAAAARVRLEMQEAAQAQLAAVRAEAQMRLDQEVAVNATLLASLEEIQHRVHTIEAEAAAMEVTRADIEARLERERTRVEQARDELKARLHEETNSRIALAKALEESRAMVSVAKAEIKASRDQVHAATERVRWLEDAEKRLVAEVQTLTEERCALQLSPADEVPRLYPGPTRQAHRVKMPMGTEVGVDGCIGLLVDLSRKGAQVLSPIAMRPSYPVRMLLPRKDGSLLCKGQVVWAVFEMSRTGGKALYRAGVRFTEVDVPAVEAFLIRHTRHESATQSHLPDRDEPQRGSSGAA